MKISAGRILMASAFGLLCTSFATAQAVSSSGAEIPYPAGFRQWTHVKSAVLNNSGSRFDGIHYIYANEKALAGYRTGSFPDGAVIVFDMWRVENRVENIGTTIDPVERKFVDVMVRDSVRYHETGGWGFEEFQGSSRTERVINDPERQCAACHRAGAGGDFVFSKLLD